MRAGAYQWPILKRPELYSVFWCGVKTGSQRPGFFTSRVYALNIEVTYNVVHATGMDVDSVIVNGGGERTDYSL